MYFLSEVGGCEGRGGMRCDVLVGMVEVWW